MLVMDELYVTDILKDREHRVLSKQQAPMPKWSISAVGIGLILFIVMLFANLGISQIMLATLTRSGRVQEFQGQLTMALWPCLLAVCSPGLALVLAVGGGIWAGEQQKSTHFIASILPGAIAGAMGGLGAILGCLMGNARIVALGGTEQVVLYEFDAQRFALFYVGAGVLDLLLLVGMGGFGGLLRRVWWRASL